MVLERYLAAAQRTNTRASYSQATRHFEQDWGGLLPATPASISEYLAHYAGSLATNTLRQRLAGLAHWHLQQGFADPTKHALVRQTFKGIRALHTDAEKQARPLQIDQLAQVVAYSEGCLAAALRKGDRRLMLQSARDRALVLLGFWRAFRSDELVNLKAEHVEHQPGQGMTLFLPRSKGDRENKGRRISVPALSKLCPVEAVGEWLTIADFKKGFVFRRITRWGTVGESGLHIDSVIPVLRRLFVNAGIPHSEALTSHSLRRGLAGWAMANGWDLKTLMSYVGWKDLQSAARYVDAAHDDKARIELGLAALVAPANRDENAAACAPKDVELLVTAQLHSYSGRTRGVRAAHRHIEVVCLGRLAGRRLSKDGHRFRILMPRETPDATLNERISDLLDEMHQVASHNDCYLEASVRDPASGRIWD